MTTAAWRNRGRPAYWAFLVHRVSGLALAVFLPLHFLALAQTLRSDAALDGFLRWTRAPLVEASEILLVFLLAAHLTGGLRILFVEFVGWRSDSQKALMAAAGGVALFCAAAFALNLVRA
jgi:fumarate reductase subunit D